MSIESWNLFCSLSTIDSLLCFCYTFGCNTVKHRGILKTNKPSLGIYSSNRSRAGACTAIHYQVTLNGVCADKILKQGYGLLRGVDAVDHRWDKEHIAGISAPILGFGRSTLMFAVVCACAVCCHFPVRLTITELRIIHRAFTIEHQYVLGLFQWRTVGIEKAGAAFLIPHPLIAKHINIGYAKHLVIGTLGEDKHRAIRFDGSMHCLPEFNQRQRHIPEVPGGTVGRVGYEHIYRVLRQSEPTAAPWKS